MKLHLSLKVLIAAFLAAGSTSLVAETMVLNADDGNGRLLKITSPDELLLDPDAVVVAVDAFGDEDREVNGVLFQSDKTDDDQIGKVERDGVTVDLTSTHFIDGWAAAPDFSGGEGNSAENLSFIMEDIRWSQAPNPLTMDVSGLDGGGLYELQILVNEGGDRDRHWDISVNDVLAVDDFTSEGTNEGDDVYEADNSFVYVGEFEANSDGELNVIMQQHIGGQDQLGGDNNPILQAFIVSALNTSDDDPNVLTGSKSRFGQVASTPASVRDINIRNTGPSKELVISKVEFSGPDMANFTILNELPVTIPPDTRVDGDPEPKAALQVSFDPAGRTGAFAATLTISSNDQTEATHVVEISASVINRLGPASHLPLDEAAGATEVADVSGNNNGGLLVTPAGTATLGQDPGIASGTGLAVSGGGELVIEGGAIPTLESFSVSMWLQLDSLAGGPGTVFAKGNVETPAFALLVIGSSLGWLPEEAGESPEFIAENVLTEGQAHHIVAVHDDTSGARSVTLYVDGTAVATQADPLPINDLGDLALQFGSYNGGLLIDGLIDDVQVYTRAISAEDVALMTANPGDPLPISDDVIPIDSDGDGLVDTREAELGTNALEVDTDGDGLNDFVEVETHLTDPLDPDTDADESGDQVEVLFGTDPLDPESRLGTFAVRTVSATGFQYTSVEAFKEGLEDPSLIGEEVVANYQVINFRDNAEGHFSQGNVPFPLWDDFADRNDFGIYAFGKIKIAEAGPRTFGVNSDDGFELRIDGELVAEFPDPRGSADTFGTADLSEGEHDLELWFFERGGGAQVELFVNTELGQVEFFEDGNFVLLPAFGEASADTDNDTLSDFWENAKFGNLEQTADGDPDEDGLANGAEEDAGTDPTNADSDGDSLTDGAELAGDPATDPLRADTDGDSLSDSDEIAAGTNPTLRDTDGDKFGDGFEIAEGFNPLDANSPGIQAGGPIPTRIEAGKLTSVDNLFIHGAFTHAVNVAETGEDVQVGDISFVADTPGPDNIEIDAQNHIEDWGAANNFGEEDDNVGLAKVASGIRWSGQPAGVTVTLKDVDRGAYRLQMIFGEKCCDRGFVVTVDDEIILDAFSPNEFQEGDHAGESAAYVIYEFNQTEAGDLVIHLNGTDAGFPDGNAILSGVSLQFIQSIDDGGASVPIEGLVGLWQFDGSTADGSGSGNDGSLENGASLSDDVRDGATGQSLLVDGGEQHVLVPHNVSLDITDQITIAAWVKPVGDMEWDGVLAKSPSDGSGANHAGNYELRIENGTRGIHFLHQQGGADDTAFYQSGLAIVTGDQWSHIAVTGVKGGDLHYYINGELVDTWADPLAETFGATNTNPLYIGSRADLFTAMNGNLDDVALFNRALDAGEIARIMGGDFGVSLEETSTLAEGLVAYYPLDGDLEDKSGDAHGTAEGTAPIVFADGAFGQGIDLDGVDQFVSTPVEVEDRFDFSDGTGFTVSAWFRVDGFDKNWQALITKGEGSNWRVHRRGDTDHLGPVAGANAEGGGVDIVDTTDVNDGAIHNATITNNGEVSRYYLDGVLQGEADGGAPAGNAMAMLIGENADANGRTWNGLIDDVALWNRGLTNDEVATLATSGVSLGQMLGEPPVGPEPKPDRLTTGPVIRSGNSIGFVLPDGTYDIEYSTDLQTWSVIASDVSGNFEDADAARTAAGAGYYRGLPK